MGETMDLTTLNKQQLEATTLTEGPVIVIAGAGSGKTRVLTTRIAYLIEQGIPDDNILAITFTNKAAKEMQERVHQLVGEKNVWISTFHSMCVRILRKNANLIGYDRGFNILDDSDQLSVVKKIIKDHKVDIVLTPKNIVSLISKMKSGITYEDMPYRVKEPLDFIYKEYVKYLKKDNLMDFDDLLINAVELFTKSPEVLGYYQDKFQYILVDEYQDTNDIQNNLIMMLGAKHQNIFLVGDEDQSIYKFRGANYKNLRNFEEKFNAKIIKLEQNYRSTKTILDAANGVIKNNSTKHKKNLWTDKELGEKITYFRAITDGDESLYISNEVNSLLMKGVKPNEIAILYRSNFMSRKIEEGLRFINVPYVIYGGVGYFKRKEVKDLIAYLRLIVNHNDNWSLARIINEPKRKIGNVTVEKMLQVAGEQGEYLYNICENASDYFAKGLATKLTSFAKIISSLTEKIEDFELIDFIDEVLDKTGYESALLLEGDEGLFRLDNLNEFKSIILNYNLGEISNLQRLEIILEDLSLQIDNDVDERDCVKMMTMHNAKGLEFDHVFIYGLEEGLFPSSRSMDSNEDIEEERRLCYVAVTRAREKLYLTNASARVVYGQSHTNPPSRFIAEIPEGLIDFRGTKTEKTKSHFKVERNFTVNDDTYRLGDKIRHKVFGEGMVVSVDSDNVSIAFKAPTGIKKLLKGHPAIEKIE